MYKHIISVVIVLLFCAGLFLYRSFSVPYWSKTDRFIPEAVNIDPYDLFDLGVADIDGDERLDLFTANHSARQSYLLGNGQAGHFFDIGLGQDREYPGSEAVNTAPVMDEPGIYIFRKEKFLHIKVHGDVGVEYPVKIDILFPWPLREISSLKGSFMASAKESSDAFNYSGELTLREGGEIVISGEENILELPHKLVVKSEKVLKFVRVGSLKQRPRSLISVMNWRDRHSLAWHDFNGDGVTDVFIGRGGVKGQLGRVGVDINDELFIRKKGKVEDVAIEAGLVKGICPARQAAWTDANGDGLLDLHVSCGRLRSLIKYPDQLYIRNAVGRLEDKAEDFGLANTAISIFRWLDVDLDSDLDLLLFNGRQLLLKHQSDGRYTTTVLVDDLPSRPTNIALGDIDNDLDLDVFVAMRQGSIFLRNNGATLEVESPSKIGLPSEARAISFVDVDRDGYLDAHVVPGGVYLNSGSVFSSSTEVFEQSEIGLLSAARCVWYDPDIDGNMNTVCGYQRFKPWLTRYWKKVVKKSTERQLYWYMQSGEYIAAENRHWLQFDLDAGEHNREGIGAYVTVFFEDGSAQRRFVGQFETAHFGQGHYRVYFGYKNERKLELIVVTWPDGTDEQFDKVAPDQVIKLKRSDS